MNPLLLLRKAGECLKDKCSVNCCIAIQCEHVKDGFCLIYDKRPEGCRIYPHNPMALEKGYTIYFIAEDGTIINADNFKEFDENIKRAWLELVIS